MRKKEKKSKEDWVKTDANSKTQILEAVHNNIFETFQSVQSDTSVSYFF